MSKYINKEIKQEIQKLINYLYEEKKHWQECGRPKEHIYRTILKLDKYINPKKHE